MDILQLIYRPDEPQGSLKDIEFRRPTMQLRWQQGLADARTTLQASPWLAPMPGELGVRVFDVIHDILCRSVALSEKPPFTSRPREGAMHSPSRKMQMRRPNAGLSPVWGILNPRLPT
jgi:Patatin phospholipase